MQSYYIVVPVAWPWDWVIAKKIDTDHTQWTTGRMTVELPCFTRSKEE
jgi:hypothetical protein